VELYRKVPKGRKHRIWAGKMARSKKSIAAAVREREPWLIVRSSYQGGDVENLDRNGDEAAYHEAA